MIHIACTIDNNYTQHCGVMLCSLFCNNLLSNFHIYIIHNGLELDNKNKLEDIIHTYGHKSSFIKLDDSILEDVFISNHVTIATYFRILIPRLINTQINKILFLDSDIIVRHNITSLWEIDVCNCSHAAVINPGISEDHLMTLGIENHQYFNAGVMLINLKKWRELKIDERAIDFISRFPEKIKYWDQDVLNYILNHQWINLHPKWNTQHTFFTELTHEKLKVDVNQIEEARNNPAIVHFTGEGSCKPWYYHCNHIYKQEYYRYLKKTYWKNFKPYEVPSFIERTRLFILGKIRYILKFYVFVLK